MKNWKLVVLVMFGFSTLQACKEDDTDIDQNEETEFVAKAESYNKYQVEMGRLAQDHSSSQAVKAFGLVMIDHHTTASANLKAKAMASNIPVPATMREEQQTKLTQMAALNGTEFDRLYAQEMVSSHENTIELFEEGNEDLNNMGIKEFINATLPTLRQHLELANQLVVMINQN